MFCRDMEKVPSLAIWATILVNLSKMFANNKGADQPGHPCNLITTFAYWKVSYVNTIQANEEAV